MKPFTTLYEIQSGDMSYSYTTTVVGHFESGDPRSDLWHPKWLVDTGHNCPVGITTDDGCYVVLVQDGVGCWKPATHIPMEAARLIGMLVDA